MDIIDLAIRQVEREGKLAQENWMELVLDRMITIRDKIIRIECQKKEGK